MEVVLIALILTLFLIVLGGFFFLWQNRHQKEETSSASTQLFQQQIEALRNQLVESLQNQNKLFQQQLGQISTHVMESQKTVGQRLDTATQVVGDVQKSLGALGQASERIFEVGKDISSLQDLLKSPKIRGGLGEFFLEDLLRQILPTKHFSIQHSFQSGQTVDAVVRLGGRLVPIDSKFPLENFRRWMEAKIDEDKRSGRKKFIADVKKHVDVIADKYILPDEGTYDFALMYIPAENVYYETIVKDASSGEEAVLSEYSLKKKVIPVSPGSFYAYLQAITLGLKGMQIEDNAKRIMQNLSRLQGDFERFQDEFSVVGKHLGNAKTKFEDSAKRLDRFQDKLTSVAEEKSEIVFEVKTPSSKEG